MVLVMSRSADVVPAEPRGAELLRRLALNDEGAVASIVAPGHEHGGANELDDKVVALLRIAALIASDSAVASYQWAVSRARAVGISDDEIVSVLCAIASIIGSARVALAARPLAAALGYELDPLEDC